MHLSVKMAALALLAMSAGQAIAAADSVDVKVSGQIVPPACVPMVSGGAVFDYGGIKTGSLATDAYTTLSKKELDFSITCDSPMKVALKAVDNRAGTAILDAKPLAMTSQNNLFGIGEQNGINIGSYAMGVTVGSLKLDGKSGYRGISSLDNGASWSVAAYSAVWMTHDQLHSVARTDSLEPEPFTILTGRLQTEVVLNKSSALDLTQVVNFNGLATVQVVYL